jgi:hypothetical protein
MSREKKWMKGQTKREEEEKTIKKEEEEEEEEEEKTQRKAGRRSVCGARSSSSFADYHPFVMWMETAIALLSPKGIFRGVFSTGVD